MNITENLLSINKMWHLVANHIYMCHVCSKQFLDLNFDYVVIDKNINFSQNCPKFNIFIKIVFFF